MAGYITIPRDLFTDKTFKPGKANETFAFIDLIQLAEYKDRDVNIKGQIIHLNRGELATSVRILSERWCWSVNATTHALDTLERCGKVIRRKSNVTSIISIVNYDKYQPNSNAESNAEGNAKGNADEDITKEINKINNTRKKDTKVSKEKSDAVLRLYAMYPASVVRADGNRVSLKSGKDKDKLSRLLDSHTEEELTNTINQYLSENHGAYTKMFSTFLNNLPDYSEAPTIVAPAQQELSLFDQKRIRRPQDV